MVTWRCRGEPAPRSGGPPVVGVRPTGTADRSGGGGQGTGSAAAGGPVPSPGMPPTGTRLAPGTDAGGHP